MFQKVIQKLDNVYFNDALKRYKQSRKLARIASGLEHKFIVHHKKDNLDLLAQLCDTYGSDKGEVKTSGHPYPWSSHSYTDFYSRLFAHTRNEVKNVFECGLGTNNTKFTSNMSVGGKPGASLRVWRDYFPNATIYGADIDRDVLFEEDRIKTYYIDQLDPQAIADFWKNVNVSAFDFIVDDGLHTFAAGSCLFENSIAYLAQNGIYIIEDVSPKDLLRYKVFFDQKDFDVDYVTMFRADNTLTNNNLVVIRKR